MNTEFSSIVDESNDNAATNVVNGNSVVNISTANMDVVAVGSSTPTAVEANFDATGITDITKNVEENVNAPVYNLAGQKVNANAKGLLIKNGKKFMNK